MVLLGEELKRVDETKVAIMQVIRILIIIFTIPFLAVHLFYNTSQLADGQAASLSEALHITTEAITALSSSLMPIHYLIYGGLILVFIVIANKISFPTPYLMGAMFATILLILLQIPVPHLPQPFFILAQLCLGAYLGSSMNISQIGQLKRLSIYASVANIVLMLFSILLAYFLATGLSISVTTALLGIAPGGIAEMGVTAKAVGANASIVTAYQLFRIFFILLIVPPFLKWWVNKRDSKKEEKMTASHVKESI
jgi:membrane AbrB-like protein